MRVTLLVSVALVPLLAGCLGGAIVPKAGGPAASGVTIVDESGKGIPYAQLSVVANGLPLLIVSADEAGVLRELPALAEGAEYAIGAPGFAPLHFSSAALPSSIALATLEGAAAGPFLRWLPFVNMVCPSIDPPPYTCDRFGEPVLEVARDGTFWVSATSAIGRSPPIWTSRDGGRTFKHLQGQSTGLTRDAAGIEGDFAIDTAGNVYFFDILAGAAYFTSYKADGTHRWTVPHAWKPIVDRPWVRAGGPDEVWALYNTGSSSILLTSHDGGKTFDLLNQHEFPCALAAFNQDPVQRNHLFVGADCNDKPTLWTSLDGGRTWSAGEAVPVPEGKFTRRIQDTYVNPAVDELGNVYVTYTHALPVPAGAKADEWDQKAIFMARRSADGAWAGPWQVSPEGQAHLAWPASGAGGRVAMAWYQSSGDREDANSEWRLLTATSIDASTSQPHFQLALGDPEVLAKGPLGRQLGDFIETRLTPDGRVAVVYAKQVGRQDAFGGADDQVRFALSEPNLRLAPKLFLNGP